MIFNFSFKLENGYELNLCFVLLWALSYLVQYYILCFILLSFYYPFYITNLLLDKVLGWHNIYLRLWDRKFVIWSVLFFLYYVFLWWDDSSALKNLIKFVDSWLICNLLSWMVSYLLFYFSFNVLRYFSIIFYILLNN